MLLLKMGWTPHHCLQQIELCKKQQYIQHLFNYAVKQCMFSSAKAVSDQLIIIMGPVVSPEGVLAAAVELALGVVAVPSPS